jgi:ferredoxin
MSQYGKPKLDSLGVMARFSKEPKRPWSFIMAYVITDACVKDFTCAAECATQAIAPYSDDDPGVDSALQMHINPDECIDCGNCATVCVHGAIFPLDELPADKAHFAEINKAYFS